MDFVRGIEVGIDGLLYAIKSSIVRKAYAESTWQLIILIATLYGVFALCVLFFAPILLLLVWPLLKLLSVAGITTLTAWQLVMSTSFIVPFVAMMFAPTPVGEKLFWAVLKERDPAQAQNLLSRPERLMPFSEKLKSIGFYLLYYIVVLMLAFIPKVGTILALVGSNFLMGRAMIWKLLNPYFHRITPSYNKQVEFLRKHLLLCSGFILPICFLIQIPIVGPFLLPLAFAAAGRLVDTQPFEDCKTWS